MAAFLILFSDKKLARLSSPCPEAATCVVKWLTERRCLAADVGDDDLYPERQFRSTGEPLCVIEEPAWIFTGPSPWVIALWLAREPDRPNVAPPVDLLTVQPHGKTYTARDFMGAIDM